MAKYEPAGKDRAYQAEESKDEGLYENISGRIPDKPE